MRGLFWGPPAGCFLVSVSLPSKFPPRLSSRSLPCALGGHAAPALDTALGEWGSWKIGLFPHIADIVTGLSDGRPELVCTGMYGVATDLEMHSPTMICVAGTDGTIHIFSPVDGAPQVGGGRCKPFQLQSAVFSSPVLCAGRLVLGCRDDTLRCIVLPKPPLHQLE